MDYLSNDKMNIIDYPLIEPRYFRAKVGGFFMLKIKKAEDFGLGFNCMTRLYMNGYAEEILSDMIQVCQEYLKWFSYRTIICSLRDLIGEYPFAWHEKPVPEQQMKQYEFLIKLLVKQAISQKKNTHYRNDRWGINDLADDMGVVGSLWGKEKNFDKDAFYHWVMENGLWEDVETKESKEDVLPLKKKHVPLLYKVCNYMIYYSYGRHTYMPSTCKDFVNANMEIMSDDALGEIVKYLKKRNANIPENESAFDKIDSDTWIHMQEDLEAELLIRSVFTLAQEKDRNKSELEKLLKEIVNLDSLQTQVDCSHMYYQLMGLERYLISLQDDVNMQRILKKLETNKEAIVARSWECFEKEEGHKYEKIGEGVYRKKSDYC